MSYFEGGKRKQRPLIRIGSDASDLNAILNFDTHLWSGCQIKLVISLVDTETSRKDLTSVNIQWVLHDSLLLKWLDTIYGKCLAGS